MCLKSHFNGRQKTDTSIFNSEQSAVTFEKQPLFPVHVLCTLTFHKQWDDERGSGFENKPTFDRWFCSFCKNLRQKICFSVPFKCLLLFLFYFPPCGFPSVSRICVKNPHMFFFFGFLNKSFFDVCNKFQVEIFVRPALKFMPHAFLVVHCTFVFA